MAKVDVAEAFFTQFGDDYGSDGWESDPRFHVPVPPAEREAAAAALHAAGRRFYAVDERGDELEEWQARLCHTYTPNYVSDVHLHDSGVSMWVDTKGWLCKPMAYRMLVILMDELATRGVSAVIDAPPAGAFLAPVWEAPRVEAPAPPELPEPFAMTFVCRRVWRTTTTGVRYDDLEYRTTDGRWVSDRRLAAQYTGAPGELLERLRAEAGADGGDIRAWDLPVDGRDPWPLPPPDLRGA